MIKILIIEDNQRLNDELSELLQKYGYYPSGITNFENVVDEYKAVKPDLVLLDINLPYYDGYYFCRQIRGISDVPIIFITSRDNTYDEILAMTIGGDDYITKPFDNQVLLTRIAAVLKRSHKALASYGQLEAGDLILNPSSNTLLYQNKKVELSKNEQHLIFLLIQNRGKVVSRTKLIETLWDNDEFVDENTLSVNINRIRSKLSEVGAIDIIKTIRGQGYMLK
ncbi:MAG: DNA-binding response regulator [Clostridiales bacterium]|nr:MAG: DNA-binding response regulator [Clostridiales bacterium]